MYAAHSIVVPTANDLVRIDRTAFEYGAALDGKLSLAHGLWKQNQTESYAIDFVRTMRRLFAPEPAHLLDTTPLSIDQWNMIDFQIHPFVMDGGDYRDVRLGTVRFLPARIAAEQTYGMAVTMRQPLLFTVSMPQRIYERALLPFFGAGNQVTRIATLIKPILHRASLAEISKRY